MKILKISKFLYLFFPCSFLVASFQYPQRIPDYFSQHGQDKFLYEQIFKEKGGNFFIEFGAHDGISFSNTYFFEQKLNWQGICAEPIPELFEQLKKNRRCFCENACIDIHSGRKNFLKCSGFITEMYSGIIDYYDPRHLARIDKEILEYGGDKQIIEVNCLSFHELLEKYKVKQIDLLCIDIEGGEENIIRSINFEEIKIRVILVENNFDKDSIRSYLASKGYQFIARIGKDDIFQNEKWYD